jgi:hypothetical protein
MPSDHRCSNTRFRPSTYPSSRSACRKLSHGRVFSLPRIPIRHTFPVCCALTASGEARRTSATAVTRPTRNFIAPLMSSIQIICGRSLVCPTLPITGPSRRHEVPLVRVRVHRRVRERCRHHLSAAPRSPAL